MLTAFPCTEQTPDSMAWASPVLCSDSQHFDADRSTTEVETKGKPLSAKH